ncbi:hypothetical protein JCM6882_009447 [Rhodosporidiobolus microsporus]
MIPWNKHFDSSQERHRFHDLMRKVKLLSLYSNDADRSAVEDWINEVQAAAKLEHKDLLQTAHQTAFLRRIGEIEHELKERKHLGMSCRNYVGQLPRGAAFLQPFLTPTGGSTSSAHSGHGFSVGQHPIDEQAGLLLGALQSVIYACDHQHVPRPAQTQLHREVQRALGHWEAYFDGEKDTILTGLAHCTENVKTARNAQEAQAALDNNIHELESLVAHFNREIAATLQGQHSLGSSSHLFVRLSHRQRLIYPRAFSRSY